MDIAVHWVLLRYLSKQIRANTLILVMAIIFDVAVLVSFVMVKSSTDVLVIYAAVFGLIFVFLGERLYLRKVT